MEKTCEKTLEHQKHHPAQDIMQINLYNTEINIQRPLNIVEEGVHSLRIKAVKSSDLEMQIQ